MKQQNLPTEVVVFPDRLYLTNVKRYPDGSIHTGVVENGAWYLRIKDGFMNAFYSCDDPYPDYVNRWPVSKHMAEVTVQPHWRGGYNKILELAEKEYREE